MRSLAAFLSIFLMVASAFADQAVVVSKIQITGLKRTNEWVLRRELRFAVGDTVSPSQLQAAQKRLENLTILNSVEFSVDSTGVVAIDVREAWPILPFLSVDFNEGTFSEVLKKPSTFFDKATLYAGGGDLNFRGNADMLLAFGQFGSSQGYAFEYHSRWLSKSLPLAMDAAFHNLRVSDREWAVKDRTAYIRDVQYYLNIATRAGARSRIGTRLAYRGIEKEHPQQDETRHWRTVWISPYTVLDRRDLEWYPTRGSYATIATDFISGDQHSIRSQYDLRGYFPLNPGSRPPVLALRFAAATSSASTPGWAEYFWGFGSALRGYVGVRSQAAGYLLGDVELRFPITGESTYNVPLIGSYGERWPFGIGGVLFVERAELQHDGERAELYGVGGGLHIRAPYVQIVETAISVSRDGKTQFDLITGVRF